MSSFVKVDVESVDKALSNYKKRYNASVPASLYEETTIQGAKEIFESKWYNKLRKVPDFDFIGAWKYLEIDMFDSLQKTLYIHNLLSEDNLDEVNFCSCWRFTYEQLKDLRDAGKDLSLTSDLAKFVSIFKESVECT